MGKVEIRFVVDIIGHDEATIIQMYNDWLASPDNYNSSQLEPLVSQKIADDKSLWLDNLLCTIHRDGGHYIADNGCQKAYDKAMEKIIAWLQKEDSNSPAERK